MELRSSASEKWQYLKLLFFTYSELGSLDATTAIYI